GGVGRALRGWGDARRYGGLVGRDRKKQFMPRGQSADWSQRAAAALRSRTREREFVQLVPLLTQCEAMARGREVTQPSNLACAEADRNFRAAPRLKSPRRTVQSGPRRIGRGGLR